MNPKIIWTIKKSWKRIRTEQILAFGGVLAGLFLIYISSLNIYLETPVTDDELRLTQGLVGFSFIFTTLALFVSKKRS